MKITHAAFDDSNLRWSVSFNSRCSEQVPLRSLTNRTPLLAQNQKELLRSVGFHFFFSIVLQLCQKFQIFFGSIRITSFFFLFSVTLKQTKWQHTVVSTLTSVRSHSPYNCMCYWGLLDPSQKACFACTPNNALTEQALWCVLRFWRDALILIDPCGWHPRRPPTNHNKQSSKSNANVSSGIMRTMRVFHLQLSC